MASTFGVAADILGFEGAGIVLVDNSGPNEDSQNATCPDNNGSIVEETVFGLKNLYQQVYRIDTLGTSIDIPNVGDLINSDYLNLGGSAEFSLTGETGVMVTFNVRNVPSGFVSTREFDTELTIPGGPGIPDYLFTTVAGKATALSIEWGTSDFDGLDGTGNVVAVEVAACRIAVTVEMQSCDGTPSLTWGAGYTDESKDAKSQTNTGYPVYTFRAFRNLLAA